HTPRLAQLIDHEGVARRAVILEDYRAQGRRHACGIDLVFDENRNAVQRADRARRFVGRIKLVGIRERVRIDSDDRVDHRAFLVIGRDAVEIELRQLMRGQPPGLVGGLNRVDRGFYHFKRRDLRYAQGRRTYQARYRKRARQDRRFQRLHLMSPSPWSYRDGGTVLGVTGFRLREKLTIRPTMAPMPPPMAWPNNNLEVAYRMTSGIWTTAGICAPCGSPPGDVYHDSIGGTRNEATTAPSRAPASMSRSAVFTIQISITRRRRHHPVARTVGERRICRTLRQLSASWPMFLSPQQALQAASHSKCSASYQL